MNLNYPKITHYYRTAITLAIITFVLAAGASLLYWDFYRSRTDTLARFLPADSLFYFHLDYPCYPPTDPQLAKLFDYLFTDLDNLVLAKANLKLSKDLKPYLDREIGIFLDKDNHWNLLIKVKNTKKLLPKLSSTDQFWLIDQHYLLISSNPETKNQLEKIRKEKEFSLAKQIPWLKNYDHNLIKIYFRPQLVLPLITDDSIKKLVENYFNQNNWQYLYLSLDPKLNFFLQTNQEFKSANGLITSNLPQSTILTIATSNLLGFYQNFAIQMQKNHPVLYQDLQQAAGNYKEVYQFNWGELLTLFNQPAQIIITQDTATSTYHYLLVFPTTNQENLTPLDDVIKNITAHQYPQRVTKTLPDGTKVKELIIQPDQFKIAEIPWADKTIKTITNHQPLWEIAYIQTDQKLIISTSINDLGDLISPEDNLDLKKNCALSPPANFYLKFEDWLSFDFLAKYKEISTNLTANVGQNLIWGCLK